jgi:hypothetical protein
MDADPNESRRPSRDRAAAAMLAWLAGVRNAAAPRRGAPPPPAPSPIGSVLGRDDDYVIVSV